MRGSEGLKKTALFTAIVLGFNVLSTAFALPSDVEEHWSRQFVSELYDRGIISGDNNGNFNPDSYVAADEFIKMTVCALGFKAAGSGGYWAVPYIDDAVERELIWEGEFSSYNGYITRGEAARILVRAADLEDSAVAGEDSVIRRIADYYDTVNEYKPYVLRAYANNLIKGYEDDTFRYKSPLTRGEAAVLITRLLKIKPLEGTDVPNIDTDNFYYVAPNGSDTNDGSINAPFATVQKARDTVRNIIAAGAYPEEGITVVLRGGDYYLGETLSFNGQDSGTNEAPVKYTSYDGEIARLTGGVKLSYSDFRPVSEEISAKLIDSTAKKNVLQLDLKKAGITELGQLSRRGFLISAQVTPQAELYIDGSRMQLSRWPNNEWAGTTEIVRSGARSQQGVLEGAIYKIDYTRPDRWKTNIEEIYTSGVLGPNYFYGYFPIEKIEKGQITLKEGSVTQYYSKHFIRYENILEETDAPGEYYIDRTTGMLYLYPPEGFSENTDIRISQLGEHLIRMESTKNIVFENIKIDSGRAGGIRAVGADNVVIKNCEISGIGTDGIYISGTNNTVKNSYIHDIGSIGINMNGGDYNNLISSGNVIENNHIEKAAQLERSYCSGITLGYRSVGIQVRNNKIHDMPHAALIIYGPEHVIEYNEIYDAVKEFHDMDAIYLNVYQYPWERGVTIKNNYIHDLGKQTFTERQMNVAGIRTDNQGNGLNVIGNVFYNIGYDNANQIRSVCAEGIDNVVKNNIFIDTSETYDGPDTYKSDAVWDLTKDSVAAICEQWKIFSPKYSEKYPEVAAFFEHHPAAYAGGNSFLNNLIVNIAIPLSMLNGGPNSQGFRGSLELVHAEENYITKTDPGFVDYAAGNFNLKDDSEVYTKIPGFEKVDFSEMGNIAGEVIGTMN